jgi:periplasmic protein TonB
MFDTIASPAQARRRFGAPAAVSLALHLLTIAAVPAVTLYQAVSVQPQQSVFVLLNLRRPAAAAAAAERSSAAPKPQPQPKRKVARRVAAPAPVLSPAPVAPAEPPAPEPPAPDAPAPSEEPARPDGVPGGLGVAAGSSLGLAKNAEGRVEYDDALMTPPERISGPDPEYTYLARIHGVQGLMLVKCVVTTAGLVRDCRVVQGLPYMEGAVVDALLRRRYTPARLGDGRPIEVEYTFRIRLQLVR